MLTFVSEGAIKLILGEVDELFIIILLIDRILLLRLHETRKRINVFETPMKST